MSTNLIPNKRISFATIQHPIEYPDFLEIQLKSFQDFFQLETTPDKRNNEGLFRVFKENFPITDTRNIFVLEFLDYFIDPPRYTIDECMERGLTYSVPLKAKLKLSCNDEEHVDFETIVQDVFLGNIPYMTPRGTFVINGAERVVVSQLHRSPGVFFGQSVHPNGTKIYSARVIPFKGAWMEFATDINNVMYAYIDRKKKFPVTTLLRAIGYETDKDILELFGMADEVKVDKKSLAANVGRRLAARVLRSWTEDFVDEDTGEVVTIERNEVVLDRDSVMDEDNMNLVQEMGIKTVAVFSEADRNMPFVRFADEAYCIGPALSAQSYLRAEKIIETAKNCGADAIHPGYGFLSENADFVDLLEKKKIVFVGPPSSAIRAMGSKAESKKIMEAAKVPIVPGYHGESKDP